MQADNSNAASGLSPEIARARIEGAAAPLVRAASAQLLALAASRPGAAPRVQHIESHLAALVAALDQRDTGTLTRHAQSVLSGEGAREDLRMALEVLGQVIREQLGEHVWAASRRALDPALEWLATPAASGPLAPGAGATDLAPSFTRHILAGDRLQAEKLVFGALEQGQTIRDVYLDVLQPSLYQIGSLWEIGQVSIAQEHLATAITQSILSAIYARVALPTSLDRNAVVACLAGNFHEIGPRMLADFLQMAGYNTRFLGTNTSADCLIEIIQQHRPDVVGLAATTGDHVEAVKRTIERIRADFVGYRPTIMVGGLAFNLVDGLWKAVEADLWREDGGQAVDELVGSSDWV